MLVPNWLHKFNGSHFLPTWCCKNYIFQSFSLLFGDKQGVIFGIPTYLPTQAFYQTSKIFSFFLSFSDSVRRSNILRNYSYRLLKSWVVWSLTKNAFKEGLLIHVLLLFFATRCGQSATDVKDSTKLFQICQRFSLEKKYTNRKCCCPGKENFAYKSKLFE